MAQHPEKKTPIRNTTFITVKSQKVPFDAEQHHITKSSLSQRNTDN
jgi:hypothetical protein